MSEEFYETGGISELVPDPRDAEIAALKKQRDDAVADVAKVRYHNCKNCGIPCFIQMLDEPQAPTKTAIETRAIQCADCLHWICAKCIVQHFETDAAKRIVDLEATIKAKDAALEFHVMRLDAEPCPSCTKEPR